MEERLFSFVIHALVDFLQIPSFLKYNFINKWNIEFDVFAGYFVAIPVVDTTQLKMKDYYKEYNPNNPEDRNYPFEYYDSDEHWFGIRTGGYKLNKGIELGILINYNKYYIELKYTRDLQVYGAVYQISSINKRTHILNILLGMNFE